MFCIRSYLMTLKRRRKRERILTRGRKEQKKGDTNNVNKEGDKDQRKGNDFQTAKQKQLGNRRRGAHRGGPIQRWDARQRKEEVTTENKFQVLEDEKLEETTQHNQNNQQENNADPQGDKQNKITKQWVEQNFGKVTDNI